MFYICRKILKFFKQYSEQQHSLIVFDLTVQMISSRFELRNQSKQLSIKEIVNITRREEELH